MRHLHHSGRPRLVRKAPAAREAKRPNGHKVQLALRREIERLQAELEREQNAVENTRDRLQNLEDELSLIRQDRNLWRTRASEHVKLIERIEALLGLSSPAKTWEERQERLVRVLAAALQEG